MTARPSFVAAWAAATRIYDANDSIGKVKQVIGGKVKHNFEIAPDEGGWSNSCAVRMIMFLTIPGIPFLVLQISRYPVLIINGTSTA